MAMTCSMPVYGASSFFFNLQKNSESALFSHFTEKRGLLVWRQCKTSSPQKILHDLVTRHVTLLHKTSILLADCVGAHASDSNSYRSSARDRFRNQLAADSPIPCAIHSVHGNIQIYVPIFRSQVLHPAPPALPPPPPLFLHHCHHQRTQSHYKLTGKLKRLPTVDLEQGHALTVTLTAAIWGMVHERRICKWTPSIWRIHSRRRDGRSRETALLTPTPPMTCPTTCRGCTPSPLTNTTHQSDFEKNTGPSRKVRKGSCRE